MSVPILRLMGLVVVLFSLLVAFTSRWTVFEAEALRDKTANRRTLLAEERIKRGLIRTADRRTIAANRPLSGERYTRRYPEGELFAHPIGYAFTRIGRAGVERARNDELTGREAELVGVLDSLLGEDRAGNTVRTTLSARAQAAARRALGQRNGAVVALDVRTGAVLVMWSSPSFDPNTVDDAQVFRRLNRDDRSPLVNRATQGLFPPGSTFKVVTAAAAIDSGRYRPDSTVSGENGKVISGVPLNNFGNQDFGRVDLTTALTKSVNTVWAEVAEKLGKDTMAEYMEEFGFYEPPPIDDDLPEDVLAASGERSPRSGRLLSPTSDQIDVGRMAIGQDKLLVTPLQMASVAQTIANGGVRMEPFLVGRVIDPEGRTVSEAEPQEAARVTSRASAEALTAMMRNVVREGTGTAAALQGVEVAGKTGTAEIDIQRRINDPWFIGFTDRFAVAVVVERVQGGQGGTVAAPIAKQVLEALGE